MIYLFKKETGLISGVAGFKCGHCGGEKFPEGMHIYLCSVCGEKIHGGCWSAHRQMHISKTADSFKDKKVRHGIMGAYGVIRWLDNDRD